MYPLRTPVVLQLLKILKPWQLAAVLTPTAIVPIQRKKIISVLLVLLLQRLASHGQLQQKYVSKPMSSRSRDKKNEFLSNCNRRYYESASAHIKNRYSDDFKDRKAISLEPFLLRAHVYKIPGMLVSGTWNKQWALSSWLKSILLAMHLMALKPKNHMKELQHEV